MRLYLFNPRLRAGVSGGWLLAFTWLCWLMIKLALLAVIWICIGVVYAVFILASFIAGFKEGKHK